MTKIATIIPARGGSKGVPGKNIRMLGGKPLIAYSVEQALDTPGISDVFVSTDCDKIATISEEFGAKVIVRPDILAQDNCSSESAILHAMDYVRPIEYDYWVFLQCTSPFRRSFDIQNAIAQIQKDDADSLLSVTENHRFLWQQDANGAASINYDYKFRPRRQDMALQYQENGSIYIFKPWVIEQLDNRLGGKIALYVMDQASEIDIDTEWDLTLARQIMAALVD